MKTISFFIPRANASGDDPASPTALNELYSTSDNNSVAVSFVPGAAIISFDVGSPKDQTVYSGRVQFHWQLGAARGRPVLNPIRAGKTPGAIARVVHLNAGPVKANPIGVENDAHAAELSTKVLRGFPPNVQPTVNALFAKKAVIPHALPVHRAVRTSPPSIHRATPSYIRATKVPDPVSAEREAQLLKLYCETYPSGKSAYLSGKHVVNHVVSTSLTTSAGARGK